MTTNYGNMYAGNKATGSGTPQSIKADESQVLNDAGGYTFKINHWSQLARFLFIGATTNTFYSKDKKAVLTDSVGAIRACLKEDYRRAIDTIVEVSDSGRAFKNDEAIFALAVAASYKDDNSKRYAANVRGYALSKLQSVCRTGTHWFQFVDNAQSLGRGWGRSFASAIAGLYLGTHIDKLVLQVIKYRQRNGWSHRDLLRLSHPKTNDPARDSVFRWITGGAESLGEHAVNCRHGNTESTIVRPDVTRWLPETIHAFESMQAARTPREAIDLIGKYNLPWETIPTELLGRPEVWEALVPNLPPTALLRNLARMSANGLIAPRSVNAATQTIIDRLSSAEFVSNGRLHPLSIYIAYKVYSSGRGDKGNMTWAVNKTVANTLADVAFYNAFKYVQPSGKRILAAIDISGSMDWSSVPGVPNFYNREAAAIMAMSLLRSEPNVDLVGFSHQLVPLDIKPDWKLDRVISYMTQLPFGNTDCAMPMQYARGYNRDTNSPAFNPRYAKSGNRYSYDLFAIFTDNETWFGGIHPHEALVAYRRESGINARLIVAAFENRQFSIADPKDRGMLDVVGFDSALPAMISLFANGEI